MVTRLKEKTGLVFLDHLRYAPDSRTDNRQAIFVSFKDNQGIVVIPDRGQNTDITVQEKLFLFPSTYIAVENNVFVAFKLPLQLRKAITYPCNVQSQILSVCQLESLTQDQETLESIDPA
jgi:hypothetical protein